MKVRFLVPFFFLIQLLFLQGCIDDDKLDFPDPEEPLALTESLSIITYLNYVSTADSLPFEFLYPVHLGYPSEIAIEVKDRSGLVQTSRSQNDNFYVDRVNFPLLARADDVISNIESEEEFKDYLIQWGIPTLRDKITETLFNCLDLVFPLKLVVDSAEVEFSNLQQVQFYIGTKPADFQPEIVFPISVFVYEVDSAVSVKNIYSLFRLFETCEGCPDVFVDYEKIELYHYLFEARYPAGLDLLGLGWEIDGKPFSSDSSRIETELTPGTHEICVTIVTPDCQSGATDCEIVEVARYCPDLSFETIKESRTAYKFLANFEYKELFDYRWVLYKGAHVIVEEQEKVGNQDHKFLTAELDTGSYKLWMKADIEGCGSLSEPKEFSVPLCRTLHYEARRDTATLGYNFIANFEGRFETNYEWSVFVNGEWVGGKEYHPGTGEDHTFYWQFERGVSYKVCLHQRDCEDTWFCETYTIQ